MGRAGLPLLALMWAGASAAALPRPIPGGPVHRPGGVVHNRSDITKGMTLKVLRECPPQSAQVPRSHSHNRHRVHGPATSLHARSHTYAHIYPMCAGFVVPDGQNVRVRDTQKRTSSEWISAPACVLTVCLAFVRAHLHF